MLVIAGSFFLMPSPPTLEQRIDAQRRSQSPVVMRQTWRHLMFLHWEFSVEALQATLPKGLHIDTFEGKAYIGIVPFFMENVRPRFCPSLPWLSNFLELNLRTYVTDDHGNPGVWFYSLDCNQPIATWIAQTMFHLPYKHARMSAETSNEHISYYSRRKKDTVEQRFSYPSTLTHSQIAEPSSLEFFLLERYRLFSVRKNGDLYSGLVHHPPYEYQALTPDDYSTRLFHLSGLSEPTTPPVSCLITEPLNVSIHPLRAV